MRFLLKNLDFILKNLDFLLKNDDFILKQDGFIGREKFIQYFSGEWEGMVLSRHLPPAVLLQQNTPYAVSSKATTE